MTQDNLAIYEPFNAYSVEEKDPMQNVQEGFESNMDPGMNSHGYYPNDSQLFMN